MEKKEFDLDVNKLMSQKLEKIRSTLLSCNNINDIKMLLNYTKFSINSLRNGKIKFDENDTLWKSISNAFDSVKVIDTIDDIRKVCKLINSIEEINLSVLDDLEYNQGIEDNLVSSIKSKLFEIKESEGIEAVNKKILSIRDEIEKTINWRSMKIPNTIIEVIDGCTVKKNDIEKINIESFIVNISFIFNGLLKSYTKEGSSLDKMIKVSEKISNLLSNNLSEDEMKLIGFKVHENPFIPRLEVFKS